MPIRARAGDGDRPPGAGTTHELGRSPERVTSRIPETSYHMSSHVAVGCELAKSTSGRALADGGGD